MAYVILPVILPADLTPKPAVTGLLRPNQIVKIPGGGRLHPQAARAYAALIYRARQAGFVITYSGDPYRDYDGQEQMFRDRYSHTYSTGGSKYWSTATGGDNRWWYKIQNPITKKFPATAAVPGTSNHGLGLAIDMALDEFYGKARSIGGTPADAWMQANVADFGFSYETIPSEPWHIRLVCGDNMPQAVLDYEALLNPLPPPNPTPSTGDKTMQFVIKGSGPSVYVTDWMTKRHINGETYDLFRLISQDLINGIRMQDVPGAPPGLEMKTFFQLADAIVDQIPLGSGGGSPVTIDYAALAKAVNDDAARRMVA